MISARSDEITILLRSAANGNDQARSEVVDIVYPQMRQIAHSCFRAEANEHTLEPTALVHEAFLRLLAVPGVEFEDRLHFYATAARQMRRLLVDYGRRRQRRTTVFRRMATATAGRTDVSPMDLAMLLDRLAVIDPRAAEVVDLRYWGGLEIAEIARALGTSVSTVQRDWDFARLWLAAEYRT